MSIWRTIPGFPGYAISDKGELVSPSRHALTRLGFKKNYYSLKRRDGTLTQVRIDVLLKKAMKSGRVVPDPIEKKPCAEEAAAVEYMPDGFVPIPTLAPFCIDRHGTVWNSSTKGYLKLHPDMRVRLSFNGRGAHYAIGKLLDMTFGPGAAEAANLQQRRPYIRSAWDEYGPLSSARYGEPRPKRHCHDCGAPTNDYRCQKCRDLWRRKHCVTNTAENGGDFDSL